MNKFFRSFFKSFTPYQISYLAVVFVITALFVIFFPDLMLDDTSNTFVVVCSVITTLANPVCELLISKQSKLNFVVDFFFIEITEFAICVFNGWYSIALVTLCFWIPIDIVSFVRWSKHPDSEKIEETVVRKLTRRQDVLIGLAIMAFTFGIGSLMRLIPGATDSYLDALAAACGMSNGILLLLRYREQWFAWFVTLVLYTILYSLSGAYILLITVAAMFVNTCYGFFKWTKYTKAHEGKE